MKKKSLIIISGLMLVALLIGGVTFAWFNYYSEGSNNRIGASDLFLNLESGTDTVTLRNVFPESAEEAREKDNNTLTFTVSGKNTTEKNIYYEIKLLYGDDMSSPYERFNDKDLVFDLIEVDENNNETYLLDAVSYETINNRKIWIGSVNGGTTSELTRTYKLRMWLNENVIISDTDSNRSYYATGEHAYKNHYSNVKVAVFGDLTEKSLPATSITRNSYVENGTSYFITKLSNDYFLEEEG